VQTKEYNLPGFESDAPLMGVEIPMDNSSKNLVRRVKIRVPVDQPLENIGRRISLFGRLFDEHAYNPDKQNGNQPES
jgi:hypothetical protein